VGVAAAIIWILLQLRMDTIPITETIWHGRGGGEQAIEFSLPLVLLVERGLSATKERYKSAERRMSGIGRKLIVP